MEIITLTNGKRVANFSSPHEFKFEDGSVLKAVINCQAELLKVTFHERTADNGDTSLTFSLSDVVLSEVERWLNLYLAKQVDVVFCPLPMITALKESGFNIKGSPFRSIRVEDRINKLISIYKQCI